MPNTREKLIELLADVGLCHYNTIADHLIANGVTIPVRCKDCQWWKRKGLCPMYGLTEDGYCSYGERREGK